MNLIILSQQLENYRLSAPHNKNAAVNTARTLNLIAQYGAQAFDRSNFKGHITASAFVLSPDRTKILLMHHTKLDRWLQPGGHCELTDAQKSGSATFELQNEAFREAHEETGARLKIITTNIFDIDIHDIPGRKDEPAHVHYDVRFLFEADPDALLTRNSESKDLAWLSITELNAITDQVSVLISQEAMADAA